MAPPLTRPLAWERFRVRPGDATDITFASILSSPCSCDRNIANKRRRLLCPEFYDGVSERGNLPGPSPHADPEQGHRLPSPIDQPALNVKAHSSRHGARSPPLAPSLARDLLPGDTTVLMTRFGSSSMGLLGWGRWKLWKSTWKVTDHDDHSLCILSGLLSRAFGEARRVQRCCTFSCLLKTRNSLCSKGTLHSPRLVGDRLGNWEAALTFCSTMVKDFPGFPCFGDSQPFVFFPLPCVPVRARKGQRFKSLATLTCPPPSISSWFSWSRVKVPEVHCFSDGSAASTPLTSGVGGIQQGRRTMESKTEDGAASSRLSQDSALFSGSCIPAISVIISKREEEEEKS